MHVGATTIIAAAVVVGPCSSHGSLLLHIDRSYPASLLRLCFVVIVVIVGTFRWARETKSRRR